MKYERLTKRLPDGSVKIESKTQWAVLYPENYTGYDMEAKMRLAELEDKIENGTLVELPFIRQRKNGQWEIIYIDENGYTSVRAFTTKDEAEKRLKELRSKREN